MPRMPLRQSHPPLELHRLKHHLNKNGFHCDVLDLDFEGHKLDDYLKLDFRGLLSGHWGERHLHFNMVETLNTTWQFHDAASLSGGPVTFIGGGQEATMNYQQVLKAGGLDMILTGFCEERLEKLLSENFRSYWPGRSGGRKVSN